MEFYRVTFVLMVAAQTLLAAVMSNHFTNGQEIEENLFLSKRRSYSDHDHRHDSAYGGIFSDEDDIEELKHLEPFEVKPRMKAILETMDKNKNLLIEKSELADRLLETYKRLSAEESDSEFQNSDVDGDGYVTWVEYVGETYASHEFAEDDAEKEEKDIFFAADVDHDGHLSLVEFRYFYTPEDYPHMKSVVLQGVIDRFDVDGDRKITFDEFIRERKEGHDLDWLKEEKIKFEGELDSNKNGVLDENELYDWATPSNTMLAETEADNLITKSDKNKDGLLSFDEILDNYLVFISPESEGYYIFRDEL